jgi:pimeloyl-ACP methyl ester carboxylesterase
VKRSTLSLALLVALTATAWSQPQREFGPDTTSTGDPHTGQGLVTPGLRCEPPAAPPPAPLQCSGYLASGLDATLLDVTVWVPRIASPHPLVVGMHGWGGNKNSLDRYANRITAEGYTFLTYSARGFGNSFGQTNLADVNVEAADLRSLMGQVADHPRLHVDPSAVAVFGVSYGGAHAWLAAIQPVFKTPRGQTVTIRTIAPLATWTELTGALRPNGRREEPIEPAGGFKFSFVQGLYLGGCRDLPVCSNYPEYLKIWNAWMVATEPNNTTPRDREIVDGLSGYRSIYWQPAFWNRVVSNRANGLPQLAVFQAQGWTDDLFPKDEVLRMYNALKAIDPNYPIALYLGDIGHPRAANKPQEVDFVINQLFPWFAWYLKGEGTAPPLDVQAAITRPRSVAFTPEDVIRVPTYADLASQTIRHQFPDGAQLLTFNPANTSGVIWDPLVMLAAEELAYFPDDVPSDFVPGDVAVYEMPVGANLLIAGEPMVTFSLDQPTAFREQFNVRLFEVKPDTTKHLITRGTYTIDTGDPTQPIGHMTITIPTYGNLWEAQAGGTLRLEITNVDSPYIAPSKVASTTLINGVSISIPIRPMP